MKDLPSHDIQENPVSGNHCGSGVASGDDRNVLKVPRRMGPTWMVDGDGMILPDYRCDYVVSPGTADDSSLSHRDRTDAFANVAPHA